MPGNKGDTNATFSSRTNSHAGMFQIPDCVCRGTGIIAMQVTHSLIHTLSSSISFTQERHQVWTWCLWIVPHVLVLTQMNWEEEEEEQHKLLETLCRCVEQSPSPPSGFLLGSAELQLQTPQDAFSVWAELLSIPCDGCSSPPRWLCWDAASSLLFWGETEQQPGSSSRQRLLRCLGSGNAQGPGSFTGLPATEAAPINRFRSIITWVSV